MTTALSDVFSFSRICLKTLLCDCYDLCLSAPRLDVVDMPTSEEQSTGRKREELLAALRGEVRFDRAPIEREFGTLENPVLVKSGFSSRVVGCQGGVEGVCSNVMCVADLNPACLFWSNSFILLIRE